MSTSPREPLPKRPSREFAMLLTHARADLELFSRMHMWQRELTPSGRQFLAFPWKGRQPKNELQRVLDDQSTLHWWFWPSERIDELPLSGRAKEIIMERSITFNSFLRGVELAPEDQSNIQGVTRGWSLMTTKHPDLQRVMQMKYPEANGDTRYYFEQEHEAQLQDALITLHAIYTRLLLDCPELLHSDSAPWSDYSSEDSAEFFADAPNMQHHSELLNPPKGSKPPHGTFTIFNKFMHSKGVVGGSVADSHQKCMSECGEPRSPRIPPLQMQRLEKKSTSLEEEIRRDVPQNASLEDSQGLPTDSLDSGGRVSKKKLKGRPPEHASKSDKSNNVSKWMRKQRAPSQEDLFG